MQPTRKQAEKICSNFPQPFEVKIIQSGFNYRYRNLTYSFYYSDKGTNKIVHKQKVVHFLKGNELGGLRTINPNIGLEPKPKREIEAEELKTVNKAKLCIDHIKAKKAKVDLDLNRDNTRVSNMMGHLIDELKQYL